MNEEKEHEFKSIWEELGIERTQDLKIIKNAFLTCSKGMDSEQEQEKFIELKSVYRAACAYAVDDKLFPYPDYAEEMELYVESEEVKASITLEMWLTQTLKEAESILTRFGKIFWKRTRKNSRVRGLFKTKEYIAYRENREFIEIFTDYMCYYAEEREFCKALMDELDRLQDRLGDNKCIYENIKFIKMKQQKFQKPLAFIHFIYGVGIPIILFLILSLFLGTQMLTIMAVIYVPALLAILIYKILFKYL